MRSLENNVGFWIKAPQGFHLYSPFGWQSWIVNLSCSMYQGRVWPPLPQPWLVVHLKPRPNGRKMPTDANATCRNNVGRNMLRVFGHRVATCWLLLAQVWSWSNLSQQHPTHRNMSQHGGQTQATCCAQQCCDMLCWHVAIVWPGLKQLD